MQCGVMINARSKLIQSRLITLYLELAHNIYTEPVDERLMGELIFDFTMTLPLWRIRKGRESHLRMKQQEIGAETYVKRSRVLTRKEKSKDIVLLLNNLLAI